MFLLRCLFVSCLFGCPLAFPQSVPNTINYQGRLTDPSGNPLPPGRYGLQFRIWDDGLSSGAGDLIWAQQQIVTVQSNGIFNVILGSAIGSPVSGTTPAVNDLTNAFGAQSRFIGLTVVNQNGTPVPSPTEIFPRLQLLSVPFAVQAESAQVASSLDTASADVLCPPGSITAYMGTNAPSGWLLCDGSSISRTQFGRLYNVIGTSSGAGDGFTTFNLPDLRGMFLRGANGSRSNYLSSANGLADPDALLRTNAATGGNNGNKVGSVQSDAFASHQHRPFSVASVTQTIPIQFSGWSGAVYGQPNGDTAPSTGATGGNETRPRNVYVNYIIKY